MTNRIITRTIGIIVCALALVIGWQTVSDAAAQGGTGTISGRVTETDGVTPIANAMVRRGSGCCGVVQEVVSNAQGEYVMNNVPVGTWFMLTEKNGYQHEFYNNALELGDASLITVTSGATITGIDFSLERFAYFTGRLTGVDGVTPLPNAFVQVFKPGLPYAFRTIVPNPDGTYSLDVPAGQYRIRGNAPNYSSEFYPDESVLQKAPLIEIDPGETISGIDFTLGALGTISGRVTTEGGTPIEGIPIVAARAPASFESSINAITNASGQFTMQVGRGDYIVFAEGGSLYADEYFSDKLAPFNADIVIVTSGDVTANIDFSLSSGAAITGIVYQPDGVTPAASALVRFYRTGYNIPVYQEFTNASGVYNSQYMAPGTYAVSAYSNSNGESFYGGAVLSEADPVTTTGGGTTSGINFSLTSAPRPSGTVTLNLQGRPARPDPRWSVPVTVTLTEADSGTTVIFDQAFTSDNNGVFTFNPVIPSPYTLRIKGANTLAVAQPLRLYAGNYAIDAAVLPAGDANNDNVINIADFSILAAAFGKASGTPGYDARADFNGDQVITIADFSLLASNFGQQGAP